MIFAAGTAVGFVLGTRAGRKTYEKMRDQSLGLWHNPTVHEKVSGATHTAKDKVPQVQHRVEALAKKAAHRGSGTDTGTATGVPLTEAAASAPATMEPTVPPTTDDRQSLGPNN
ncbi:YtxH domain-containing protein [Rhodococcus sp. 2H158]